MTPKTWAITTAIVKLQDICHLITDGKHGDCQNEEGSGYFFLSAKDVKEGKLNYDNARQITEEDFLQTHKRTQLEPFDILLSNSGTIGRMAMAKNTERTRRTTFQKSVAILKPNMDRVYASWLFYYLHYINDDLINAAGGTAQKNLLLRDLRAFDVEIPPLPTQRKIAAVLSAYDDLIENNTRRIKILEDMAQTIYREWFVNFRFPGHEQVKMVESELGLIPEGWEIERLANLVETQYGYTESAAEDEVGPKFVRGKDINKTSYIDWDTVPFCPIEAEKYAKYQVHVGDVLVIRMADPGKLGIVEKEIDAVFASYLIRLKLKSEHLSPYYLFYTLLDDRYQDYIGGASTGTTRKSASAGVVTSFDLVIPTDEIRNRFEVVVASLRKTINNLLERNTNLRQTRDLLLPKLISGDLDVSDLDIEVSESE